MTEEYYEYHAPEYNEFCQRVNFERVFGKPVGSYVKTLLAARKVIKDCDLTETLTDLFEGILWSELSPQGWADTLGISLDAATKEFDHAYRALKAMAAEGRIEAL